MLFDSNNTLESAKEALGSGWNLQPDVNYKYHSLKTESFKDGNVFSRPLLDTISEAFKRVRRNAFAILQLQENAIVVLFNTSDACLIELHEANGEIEEILDEITELREASSELISHASNHFQRLLSRTGTSFKDSETITHTVIVSEVFDEAAELVASRCFSAEGLKYERQPLNEHVSFAPGWSFSVCISNVEEKFWDSVAVMARAQCEWYSARVARDFCLRTLGDTDLREPIEGLLDLERVVVGYQTEFRLWRHRMEEYRANLKPGLTDQTEKIEKKWKTSEAKDYVNETLNQVRNLIQSSYSRRLLIQERRQSIMIFLLTSLGVLSISSIAATYWNWLKLAGIYQDSLVATPNGNLTVKAMLGGLIVLMLALLTWFGASRMKKD